MKPDLVVSKDARGRSNVVATISEAISKVSSLRQGTFRFVISVEAGTYDEHVIVPSSLPNITLVGDGMGRTIITGDRSVKSGFKTFCSFTVAVDASGFIAQNLTIRNTAGPDSGQAVALRIGGDQSVLFRCSIEGNQDTLYAKDNRQFYRECDISGTVDFIFGNAAAVFQHCNIYVRLHGENVIAAHGRKKADDPTGYVFQDCFVMAQEWDPREHPEIKTYLGRPWQPFARTVFMETMLDALIDPQGWTLMDGTPDSQDTVFYGEYQNRGVGSRTKGRVKWGGYKVITDPEEAEQFTVGKFIDGGSWLPATRVPFKLGL